MYPSLDDENYVEEFSITPNKILSFARQIAMAMVRFTTSFVKKVKKTAYM